MFRVFTRTWWKRNPSWPQGLEPHAGRKYTLRWVSSEDQAREECRLWNSLNKPGRLSRKAEYMKEAR